MKTNDMLSCSFAVRSALQIVLSNLTTVDTQSNVFHDFCNDEMLLRGGHFMDVTYVIDIDLVRYYPEGIKQARNSTAVWASRCDVFFPSR